MHFPFVPLSGIDLGRLRLVKEALVWRAGKDHSRWVFHSAAGEEPLVYKLWNPSYIRSENILQAVERGLYHAGTTPALRGIVVHRGFCRGYVMARCTPCRRIDAAFVLRFWEATRASGVFAEQYRRSHVMRIGAACSAIDLEGVYPTADYPDRVRPDVNIEDPDYAALVARLAHEPLSPAVVRELALRHVAGHRSRGPTLDWLRRKARGLELRLDRRTRRLRPDLRRLIDCEQGGT
jgi:hypothetical protein